MRLYEEQKVMQQKHEELTEKVKAQEMRKPECSPVSKEISKKVKVQRLYELFNVMDSDNDGVIDQHRIDLS